MLPVAPVIVAAAAGSELAREAPAHLALSTIWISYTVLAAGVLHAAAVSSFEFYRLAKLVAKSRLRVQNLVDIFIPPFTLAYCGLAVQQLGDQAIRLSKLLPVLFNDTELLATILVIFGRFFGFACVFIGMFWQCAGALIFGPPAIHMVLKGSFNTNWLALPLSLGSFGSSILTLVEPNSNRGLEISGMVWGAISIALYHVFSVKALRKARDGDLTPLFDAPPPVIEGEEIPPPRDAPRAAPRAAPTLTRRVQRMEHQISEALSGVMAGMTFPGRN